MLLQASGIIYLVVGLLFVYLGHSIAKRKGLNPVFWGVMGALLGPLMLLIIVFAKSSPKPPAQTTDNGRH